MLPTLSVIIILSHMCLAMPVDLDAAQGMPADTLCAHIRCIVRSYVTMHVDLHAAQDMLADLLGERSCVNLSEREKV
jgi:hypothetical protein